jgi:hypothetical protein
MMYSVVIDRNLHLLNSNFYVIIQMFQYTVIVPDMKIDDKQVICAVYRLWLLGCGK